MKKILMICILAVACAKKQEAPAPAPIAVSAAPTPAVASAAALSGKVLETLDSGGYTYVRVQTPSGDEWAAVPQTTIKTGETVNIAVQMTMEKFESKTLKRTFDRVFFGTIASPGVPVSSSPSPAPSLPPGHPNIAAAPQTAPADVSVPPAAGGKSVAEVWAQKAALKDGPVVVRGKVVKFLPSIMGKNWLHLRDGSGSGKNGDNDLTVTTMDTVKVGDVVTIKGTVHTDKDFGAGYSYKVIVEDAAVVR